MTDFTITKSWLNQHQTRNGGYTAEQMRVIGAGWPPQKNWKKDLIGVGLSKAAKIRFEEGKYAFRDIETMKAKILIRDFSKANLMEIDRYIERLLNMKPNEI